MNVSYVMLALSVVVASGAVPASAQAPAPSSAPAAARPADPGLSYDDPGMHFTAPAGWHRLPTPEDSSSPGLDDKKTLAAWSFPKGRNDTRVISIFAEPFDGNSAAAAEKDHEADLRDQNDTVRIDHKMPTTLPNGMPAWFISVFEGTDPFTSVQLYQYVIYDGKREIVVSYSGHQGEFKAEDAQAALAGLSIVLYPANR